MSPVWFEKQLNKAFEICSPTVIAKIVPLLCALLSVYNVKDEVETNEAARWMKVLIYSSLINGAME